MTITAALFIMSALLFLLEPDGRAAGIASLPPSTGEFFHHDARGGRRLRSVACMQVDHHGQHPHRTRTLPVLVQMVSSVIARGVARSAIANCASPNRRVRLSDCGMTIRVAPNPRAFTTNLRLSRR